MLANAAFFIVVAEEVGAQLCRVTRELDVLEGDVVDAVARGTVVLGSEDDGHADEGGAVNALHADIAEVDVANPVLVTAGEVQDGVSAGIEDVAVFDADFAQRLAHVGAVIAVRTDVYGMCHIGPECGAAHMDVLGAAPVPPTVVVKGDAVVGGAQEAVLDGHVAAAHQVDAVAPAHGGERLQMTDGDALRLSAINSVMLGVKHSGTVNEHVLRESNLDAAQGMVDDAAPNNAHILA